MRDTVLDAIQGHAPDTEGAKYGGFTIDLLVSEMELFPRYTLTQTDRVATVSQHG